MAEKKAEPKKAVESEVVKTSDLGTQRVPDGARVVAKRDEPSLDPELAKVRDEERKALDAVKIETSRPDPSIDEELVRAREAEIKAAQKFNKQS